MLFPDRYRYSIELEPEGTYRFVFPELPEIELSTRTLREGRERLHEAVLDALERRLRDHNPPEDRAPRAGEGVLKLAPTYRAKLLLIEGMNEANVSAAELGRRLSIASQEAYRILKFRHPTKIDALAAALKAIGLELHLSVRPVERRTNAQGYLKIDFRRLPDEPEEPEEPEDHDEPEALDESDASAESEETEETDEQEKS